jgi:alkylated DNA repair protein alkB family protein 1
VPIPTRLQRKTLWIFLLSMRVQVAAPGEAPVVYPKGREPQNFTALRNAERRLKKKDADLTECIDTRDPLRHGHAVRMRGAGGMFEVGDTGCVVWPGALSVAEQVELVGSCLGYSGLSNLDAHYVLEGGASGLFASLDTPKRVERKPGTDDSAAVRAQPLVQEMERAEQVALLQRLRWISIGRQYDWATKAYFDRSEPMPADVCALCARLCREAGLCDDFVAEAGIVNFYQPGDSLTSHVDRSEKRMDVPLVSVSLGASCVFVLGGESRDDEPVALLLHSGDALFLSGASRRMYHGVPRILGPSEQLLNAEKQTAEQRAAFQVLGSGRININVRQVR